MILPNVIEEMKLVLGEEETSSNGVDRGITPSLVEESTGLVKIFKVIHVCLASPEVKARNLKVTPL